MDTADSRAARNNLLFALSERKCLTMIAAVEEMIGMIDDRLDVWCGRCWTMRCGRGCGL
jgi:hypothetical protein